jgi:pyrroloquinoline quinone biosynthesis protein E
VNDLPGAARPRLARGVRLRRDNIAGKYLLLRPERGFELRGAALEIVRAFEAGPTVDGLIEELAARYASASAEAAAQIAGDVRRLLAELMARGLVELEGGGERPPGEAALRSPAVAGETPRPYTVVAELTYRCPLRCAYCSNPVRLDAMGPELSATDWARVFREAEQLGVMQVTLTGGEPLLRADLEEIVAAARAADLYTTLITSGLPLARERLVALRDRGLDGVQLSIQDTDAETAERIAGVDALTQKTAVAAWARELNLPLTLNVVLHRANLPRLPQFIALAESWGAERLELAHVQYLGWALANREALLPTAQMIADARAEVARARERLGGRMELLAVLPDYFTDQPRGCMEGWGRRYIVIAPDGRALPCHAAHTLPGFTFDSVATQALGDIWHHSEAFNRFRGDAWMPEPCRGCERRTVDFGGCRCQAFHLTGDAAATDPTCTLAPAHDIVLRARELSDAGTRTQSVIQLRRAPATG